MAFKGKKGRRAPSKRFDCFRVIEREGHDKAFWHKIGAAWENRDGSLSVVLDSLPPDGRFQIREPYEDGDAKGGKGRKPWDKKRGREPGEDDVDDSDDSDDGDEDPGPDDEDERIS